MINLNSPNTSPPDLNSPCEYDTSSSVSTVSSLPLDFSPIKQTESRFLSLRSVESTLKYYIDIEQENAISQECMIWMETKLEKSTLFQRISLIVIILIVLGMIMLATKLKYQRDTLHLALSYFHTYYNNIFINHIKSRKKSKFPLTIRKSVHGIASACLFVAAKLEEEMEEPLISEYIDMAPYGISEYSIKSSDLKVLINQFVLNFCTRNLKRNY